MATLYGNKLSPEISMSLSVEQERDSYKEKVEHMKILLKQLDQELHSQKIRKEGVETVSKLLQEARQEIIHLQKIVKTKDTQIRNLQSRLHANGLSDSIAMEEGDIFIPGTSNQVLDNLVRENTRLRTLVRGASVDPEALAKLQQLLTEKQEEIEILTRQHQTDTLGISELQTLLSSSDNEKDVKIAQLQKTVQKMKDDFQTRDILCNSLAEESNILKQHLHDVAVKCQQMALRLERSERSSNSESRPQKEMAALEHSGNNHEKLQKENNDLKKKLDEVVVMNKRWQDYDSQREAYVRRLQTINRNLEEKATNGSSGQYSVERFRKINQTITEVQSRLRLAEEEKRLIQEELTERNQQLIQQSGEVQRLKSELETALQSGLACRSDTEIIEALKAQIQICTEDFESERKDREKAQNKIAQLQSELENVKSEKNRLLQAVMPQDNFRRARDFYNMDLNISHQDYMVHLDNELATRGSSHGRNLNVADYSDYGVVTDAAPSGVEPELNMDEDNVKSITEKQSLSEKEYPSVVTVNFPSLSDEEVDSGELIERGATQDVTKNTVSVNKNETSVLTCPKCAREFMSDKHSELLEHIEVCCD